EDGEDERTHSVDHRLFLVERRRARGVRPETGRRCNAGTMPDEVADADPEPLQGAEPGNDRLDAYIRRTQTPLDLIALCTLWVVVVPPRLLGAPGDIEAIAWVVRISVSVIYGADMTIRTWLAFHRWRYLRQHVVGIVAVIFPPVRVIFSLRLIRMLFRR